MQSDSKLIRNTGTLTPFTSSTPPGVSFALSASTSIPRNFVNNPTNAQIYFIIHEIDANAHSDLLFFIFTVLSNVYV